MKVLIVFFVVMAAALVFSAEEEEDEKFREECAQQNGISEDELTIWKQGELPSNPRFRDLLYCYMKKLGYMNDSGHIQHEAIKAALTEEIGEDETEKIVKMCLEHNEGGPQGAWDLEKCYLHNRPNKDDN